MAKLIINDDEGQSFEYFLLKDEIKIGRSPVKNDLVLASKRVSVVHASISFVEGGYLLKDLNSTNGVYVNGERINEHWLSDGDTFDIANFSLKLVTSAGEHTINYHEQPLSERAQVRSASVFSNLLDALSKPHKQIDRQAELEARLQEKVRVLEMLYAFGKTISSAFDIDKIFSQIVDLCFKLTPAERCAILLWDELTDTLEPRLISFRPDSSEALAQFTLNISRTITRMVINDRISVLSEDLSSDLRFKTADSVACQSIHSVMCVPLIGKQRVLGVIYVDKLGLSEPFTTDALDLLNAVASQAAIAVDNAFAYDQLAREAVLRASYERFLPNNVVDLVLDSPEKLQLGDGITQEVAVLFADIRNFTPMAERSEPQMVVYVLNRFFTVMTEIIFAYGGTLDKFIGDGLMALFGAPYQSSNDPQNAINAAITMQRRMDLLNTELQRFGFEPIEIGIGINIGEVTVGYIGSEMRMDYTAIGNTVNIAARLMKQAEGQQILISDRLQSVVGNEFRTREIAGISLKGMSRTPDIFEVIYR